MNWISVWICVVTVTLQGVWKYTFAAQTFLEQPPDTAVNLGQSSVTLNCIVSGLVGQVFWLKGDQTIPASSDDRSLPAYPRYEIVGNPTEGEYNLRIRDILLDDDGVYECQVTPGGQNEPQLRSTPARITVRRPPVSVSIPLSPVQTVTVSIAANLTCEAKGANPAPTITWLRNGQTVESAIISVSPSDDPSGKLWNAKSVLPVMPGLGDHAAMYVCQVINAAISVPMSANVSLNVQHPPKVVLETDPTTLEEETVVNVRCVVDANPRGVIYVWTKNGDPIPGDVGQIKLGLQKEDHQAVITCSVTNAIGTTDGTLTLDVHYAPRLVEIPESTSVDRGKLAQLHCMADGNPAPTIKWTRDTSRATVSTMPNLQFDNVGENDIGLYICTATVPGFAPVIAYGRVDINKVPVIYSEPLVYGRSGSTIKLECLTETKPNPENITWSWGDKELQNGKMDRFIAVQEETPTGVKGILTICKVKLGDFGQYNCTMTNSKGSAEAVIVLEQQGLDFIFYIVIVVLSVCLIIFIASILFMVYCRRKLRQFASSRTETSSSEDSESNKVKVEIIRKLSDLHLNKDEKRRLSVSTAASATPSPPRYTDPQDYRQRRDSWDDPTYRPLSNRSFTPPPYRDESRRHSGVSSNEYMEPGDPLSKGRKFSDHPDNDHHWHDAEDRYSRRSFKDDAHSSRSEHSYRSDDRSNPGNTRSNRGDNIIYHGDNRGYRGDNRSYREDEKSYHGDDMSYHDDDKSYGDHFGYNRHYLEGGRTDPPSRQGSTRASELSLNTKNKMATIV